MIDPSAPYSARKAAFLAIYHVGDKYRFKPTGEIYKITGVYPGHWGVWLEKVKMTKLEKDYNAANPLSLFKAGRYFLTVEHPIEHVLHKRDNLHWADYSHVSEWERV